MIVRRFPLAAPLAALALGAGLTAMPAWAADSWTVVPDASDILFTGSQMGASFEGQFRTFTADIAFSPDDLAGSRIAVTIDMASAHTGSADRDNELGKEDWFAVDRYPEATFVAGTVTADGTGYLADGTLTLRGESHPLTLPFTVEIDGSRAVADGAVTIDRTLWGVGQGEWASGEGVGKEVEIRVHVEADRVE